MMGSYYGSKLKIKNLIISGDPEDEEASKLMDLTPIMFCQISEADTDVLQFNNI